MADSLLTRLLAAASSRLRSNGNAFISGDTTLQQGTNVSLSQLGSVITIDASLAALTRLRANAASYLSGDVTLAEGANITLTQVGSTITFDATGGGSGLPSPYTATLEVYETLADSLVITGPPGAYTTTDPPDVVIRGRDNTDVANSRDGGNAVLRGGDLAAGNTNGGEGGSAVVRGGTGDIAGSAFLQGGLTSTEGATAGNASVLAGSGPDHGSLTNVHGGTVNVYGGTGKGSGDGGGVLLAAGYSYTGSGGLLQASGGSTGDAGAGGNAYWRAGDSADGTGGAAEVTGGSGGTVGGTCSVRGGLGAAGSNGGACSVAGGPGNGSGSGATCSVEGGAGGATGAGGSLALAGGAAGASGSAQAGGNASMAGGASAGTSGTGGHATTTGGSGTVGGDGRVQGGAGTTTGGSVLLTPGAGSGVTLGETRVTRGAFVVQESTGVVRQTSLTCAPFTTATTSPTLVYSYTMATSESVSLVVTATADNGTIVGEVVKKALFRRSTTDDEGGPIPGGNGLAYDASVPVFKLGHDITILLDSNDVEVSVVAASSASTLWAIAVSIVSRTGPV